MEPAIVEYFAELQCSRQWKGFLRALSEEFAQQLPEAELRNLMHRLGTRFAQAEALPACRTLDELQLAMGRVWVAQDWGWVALQEVQGSLRIQHYCAPLFTALGTLATAWAPAFLEGVYQEWFRQSQAGGLQVRQVAGPDASGSIELRLEAA
ncbi:cellulose synthase [Xylophilus rhododendri]|uniref:Cellulose synthase n=1 Tax=Xylophilus rhododendri TaxID=2697032 RepID=A0A857J4P1_9BURK|nr:cellulose biosynthesis protein BcsD [Xylophilus rhododendri]QHI98930.1 cellulose synthase [Xylophilus rhododendri]